MEPSKQEIEAAAKAICDHRHYPDNEAWFNLGELQDDYRQMAKAALSAASQSRAPDRAQVMQEECARLVDALAVGAEGRAKLCAHTEDLYQREFAVARRLREAATFIRALPLASVQGIEPAPDGTPPADAATTYALWDTENTVRMRPDCFDYYLGRAKNLRHWLRVHGHDVAPVQAREPAEDRAQVDVIEHLENMQRAFQSGMFGQREIWIKALVDAIAAIRSLRYVPEPTQARAPKDFVEALGEVVAAAQLIQKEAVIRARYAAEYDEDITAAMKLVSAAILSPATMPSGERDDHS